MTSFDLKIHQFLCGVSLFKNCAGFIYFKTVGGGRGGGSRNHLQLIIKILLVARRVTLVVNFASLVQNFGNMVGTYK